MVAFNSNPEILLKKRKDKDLKRVQKQEEARKKQLKIKKSKKNFTRAETLISNRISKEIEKKRLDILKKSESFISATGSASTSSEDEKPKLLFMIRITNFKKGIKIPSKIEKVLKLLRLTEKNNSVFIKYTSSLDTILKLINPYVIFGKPSLSSIRKLFQKNASITTEAGEFLKLNDNNLIESRFGDIGLYCVEDLIHELLLLNENFNSINYWLNPFKLNLEKYTNNPLNKLEKIKKLENDDKKVIYSATVPLVEVDVNKIIDEQI